MGSQFIPFAAVDGAAHVIQRAWEGRQVSHDIGVVHPRVSVQIKADDVQLGQGSHLNQAVVVIVVVVAADRAGRKGLRRCWGRGESARA